MKSLVIIDVQNDFMPGGRLEVPHGDMVVTVINRLQAHFDLVVATQDWHPPNHASFASNHSGKKPFDKIDLHGIEQVLWPDHCVQGTMGADFHPALETLKIAAVFRKGMNPEVDSYSGFYDNLHRINTGLAGYLRAKDIKELYFCGLAADICVYFTMMDALKEGFSATLVEDASRPLDDESFNKIKKKMIKAGSHIINSSEILTYPKTV